MINNDEVIGVGEAFLELNDLLQDNDDNVAADFDLKEPLPNDFGDVEDLFQEDLGMDVQALVQQQEDVIDASSDSSESDNDIFPFNLNEPVHGEVVLPLFQKIPNEILEEDLMSSEDNSVEANGGNEEVDIAQIPPTASPMLDGPVGLAMDHLAPDHASGPIMMDVGVIQDDSASEQSNSASQPMQLGFVQIVQPECDLSSPVSWKGRSLQLHSCHLTSTGFGLLTLLKI